MLLIGFLFGIGLGFFVQRAGLCLAHGLGEIFMGKGKRIFFYFLLIFVITGSGFLLSGVLDPSLGLKPVGEIRGYGFYNILSGIIFGAGIALNGGCVLGTLRQIGEGNLMFLVVLISFIPGMALVVFVLNPLLESGYQTQTTLLPELLGAPAVIVMGVFVLAALAGLKYIRSLKKG